MCHRVFKVYNCGRIEPANYKFCRHSKSTYFGHRRPCYHVDGRYRAVGPCHSIMCRLRRWVTWGSNHKQPYVTYHHALGR
jgi:hypothetical protein